jgi:hypothetical protein
MTNQQLLDFIRQQLSKGVTKEKITSDLLVNGWTAQDIQEGFSAIPTPAFPVSNPLNAYTPPAYNNASSFITPVQKKSHSGSRIFLIVLVLFLLAGGASAYYFKGDLMNLPIVKDIFPTKVAIAPNTTPIQIPIITTPTTPTPTTPTSSTPISTIASNNGITQLVGTLVSISGNTLVVSSSGINWSVDITNATFIPQVGKNPVRYRILVSDQLSISGTANTTALTMIANTLQDCTQQEVSIKANLNNMRAEAANFQFPQSVPSYSGFCLSKEGEIGLNQLKEIGGTNLVCKDSEKTFAVGVNFSNPTLEHWCVDSVNAGHTTSVFLSGALCQ